MSPAPRAAELEQTQEQIHGVSASEPTANAEGTEVPTGTSCLTERSRHTQPSLLRRIIAGRYEVERELGAGGMGVVVAARDTKLGHRVALKMLHPNGQERPEMVARFRREARAAAALQSDHAARVLDSGVDEQGCSYTVMELLEGEDLAQSLDRRGTFAVEEAAQLLLQACDAIGEAHDKGIVHRDIKPANIFLARRPSGAHAVKVLDFGISKSMSNQPALVTITGGATLLGSPAYMSPEQLRTPQLVDPRTDVYSLTATFYELLTGAPPFVSESIPELCAMILKDPVVPPSQIRPELPPEVDALVEKGLARNRDARFQSAHELATALRPLVGERSGLTLGPSSLQLSPARTSAPPSKPPASAPPASVSETSLEAVAAPAAVRTAAGRRRPILIAASAMFVAALALLGWSARPQETAVRAAIASAEQMPPPAAPIAEPVVESPAVETPTAPADVPTKTSSRERARPTAPRASVAVVAHVQAKEEPKPAAAEVRTAPPARRDALDLHLQ